MTEFFSNKNLAVLLNESMNFASFFLPRTPLLPWFSRNKSVQFAVRKTTDCSCRSCFNTHMQIGSFSVVGLISSLFTKSVPRLHLSWL